MALRISPITVAAFHMLTAGILTRIITAGTWCYTKVAQIVTWCFTNVALIVTRCYTKVAQIVTWCFTNVAQIVTRCYTKVAQIDSKAKAISFFFGGFALIRYLAVFLLVVTFLLANASKLNDSLSVEYKWVMRGVILFPGIFILPIFPRQWQIKKGLEWVCQEACKKPWFKSLLYDIIRGCGAIACYYGANTLGSFFNNALADMNIIHASVSYILLLLTLDFLYDFEDAVEICDNTIMAGYGLMVNSNQTIIQHWWVHVTGLLLCVLKAFLRSNARLFHRMIEGTEGEEAQDQIEEAQDQTGTFNPHAPGSVVIE